MYTIKQENFIKFDETSEKPAIMAEIFVDTVNELLSINRISDKILYQGSIAYVITTGKLYVMRSDGKWYNSEGGEQS